MMRAAHISKNSMVWWPWGCVGVDGGGGGATGDAASSSVSSLSPDRDLKSRRYDL